MKLILWIIFSVTFTGWFILSLMDLYKTEYYALNPVKYERYHKISIVLIIIASITIITLRILYETKKI